MQEQIDSEQSPQTTPDQAQEGEVQGDASAVATEPDPIEQLKAENTALNESLMRALAESQNIQRRLRSQMEQDRKYAVESLVKELIPVLDNFERSIAAARRGSSTEAIIDGVTAVEKSLRRALEQYGLKRIESVGNPFDPEIHEAIATVETADYPADTVTDELEAGYVLAERVVRPARVRVSSSTGKED